MKRTRDDELTPKPIRQLWSRVLSFTALLCLAPACQLSTEADSSPERLQEQSLALQSAPAPLSERLVVLIVSDDGQQLRLEGRSVGLTRQLAPSRRSRLRRGKPSPYTKGDQDQICATLETSMGEAISHACAHPSRQRHLPPRHQGAPAVTQKIERRVTALRLALPADTTTQRVLLSSGDGRSVSIALEPTP